MRHWAYLLGGCCWLCAGGAADCGYLPTIGPSPVRFLMPGPPVPAVELPPLRTIATEVVGDTNSSTASVSPPAAVEPELDLPESEIEPEPDRPLVVEKPPIPTPPTPGSTNSFVPMLDEPLTTGYGKQNTVAVLDSLVSLFKQHPGGTNRLDPALVLPVQLLPVPSSKPPSSSAIYSNP